MESHYDVASEDAMGTIDSQRNLVRNLSSGRNRAQIEEKPDGSNVMCSDNDKYIFGKALGTGSFGVVTEARSCRSASLVAIKRVFQDPMYKNRELEVMKELEHPNIVLLRDHFYTKMEDGVEHWTSNNSGNERVQQKRVAERGADGNRQSNGVFLHLVMEHIPETVYRVIRSFQKHGCHVPMRVVKFYTFQMCRSLGYLHSRGICHRDIKPQNLLVDPKSHMLKLCDFGSAKKLQDGDRSVAYICSRFYRAPELMLGASDYTTAIDIWSLGCVYAELLLGKPLFAGESSVDQLVKIIQVMGTPTREQMAAMNRTYTDFRFPDVKPKDWHRLLAQHVDDSAISLLNAFLCYEPQKRLKPLDALAHSFFEELFKPGFTLQNGVPMPALFPLTELELDHISPEAFSKLEPYHRAALNALREEPCTA